MRHLFLAIVLLCGILGHSAMAADPTLLIFGADWCDACKKLNDAIEAAPETVLGFAVAKFDIDLEPELTKNYGIRTVPTLIVLESDGKMRRKIGFVSVEDLKQWLEKKN